MRASRRQWRRLSLPILIVAAPLACGGAPRKEAHKKQLLAAMKGHVLAEGELVGTYQR